MIWDRIQESKRLLAREQGTITKDWGGKIPFALIYPNSYYIGMSNLGVQAIYSLLNSRADAVAERVFWEKGALPVAVESQRPLADFSVLAFSFTYELDYLNLASILKASGIPLYAADRDETHPLIIAGGPCITANPMPVSPFFDCLCIGEAEVILPAMMSILSEGVKDTRHDLLNALATIPGVYVPQDHNGAFIARQWVKNLDDFPTHSVVLTPDTELGDLYLIEVERGCHFACRFCMVSNTFSPMRFRSVDSLVMQAQMGLQFRKRIGLVGPAVPEHPRFEELLGKLQQAGAELSVSSLRVKPLSAVTLREMVRAGAKTIALAPEAGSQRLRDVIRKGITDDDVIEAMRKVAEEGIKQLKFYFMIGLPTETDEDIEAIIDLTLRCQAILNRQNRHGQIILSVAPFVPKAGTPFQWLPTEQIPVINRRLAYLKNKLRPKGIQLKAESPAWSEVQAVLSRGDATIAEVLASIEEPALASWRKAVIQHHLDIDYFAHQKWELRIKLPWSILDTGAPPSRLEKELSKAVG